MDDKDRLPQAELAPEPTPEPATELFLVVFTVLGIETYWNPTNLDFCASSKYLSFDWECKYGHKRHLIFVGLPFIMDRGTPHTSEEEARQNKQIALAKPSDGRVN